MARQTIVTPAGEAFWAKVFEPEEDRFDDTKPRSWSISWAGKGDSPDTIGLMQKIEEEFARLHGEGAKPSKNAWPFRDQVDKEGLATGLMEFRFKKNERTKKGNVLQAPAVFDSRKNPWPDGVLIGNGSLCKVAFSCWGWEDKFGKKGVSLSLEAVQVLDLVPYEQRDPADAFNEENGYVADTPANAFSGGSSEEPLMPSQRRQRLATPTRPPAYEGEGDDEEVPF